MPYFDTVKAFAECGYEFIPLLPGDTTVGYRTPKKWNELGTNDLGQLEAWYDDGKYQGFGMVFKNQKAICFDLDMSDKANGVENFIEVANNYSVPQASIIIKTPRGGLHCLYKHPGFEVSGQVNFNFGAKMSNSGIDIRADRNFIATFGVVRNDKNLVNGTYELVRGASSSDLLSLPQEFIDLLPKAQKKQSYKSMASDSLKMMKGLVEHVDAQDNTPLFGKIPEVIYNGGRDNTLTSLAASWARTGLDKSIMMILMTEAARRCEKYPEFSIEEKVDSALSNPAIRYNRRDVDLDYIMKDLVFISGMNKYIFLHNRRIVNGQAVEMMLGHLYVEQEMKTKDEEGNFKVKQIPIFQKFRSQSDKLIVKSIGYKPGANLIYKDKVIGDEVVNMYVDPMIKPVANIDKFDKFCEFASLVCGSDEKGMILIEFIAFLIQNPSVKIGIALVVITRQGAGKGLFIDIVKELLGGNNVGVLLSDNLASNFNKQLSISQLIVVNEAIGSLDSTFKSKRQANIMVSRLKAMITDEQTGIELKGVDLTQQEIYPNFLFFSNDEAAVSFDRSDRRLMCIINDNPPMEDFEPFIALLKKDAVSAIKHGLISLTLNTVHERMKHVDKTYDDEVVIRANMDGYSQEIFDDIRFKRYIFTSDIMSRQLFGWYCMYKFGLDIVKDTTLTLKLIKEFFVPLMLSSKHRQPKEIIVKTPMFELPTPHNSFDNPLVGGDQKHRLYITRPAVNEITRFVSDFGDNPTPVLRGHIDQSINNFKRDIGHTESKIETPPYIKELAK